MNRFVFSLMLFSFATECRPAIGLGAIAASLVLGGGLFWTRKTVKAPQATSSQVDQDAHTVLVDGQDSSSLIAVKPSDLTVDGREIVEDSGRAISNPAEPKSEELQAVDDQDKASLDQMPIEDALKFIRPEPEVVANFVSSASRFGHNAAEFWFALESSKQAPEGQSLDPRKISTQTKMILERVKDDDSIAVFIAKKRELAEKAEDCLKRLAEKHFSDCVAISAPKGQFDSIKRVFEIKEYAFKAKRIISLNLSRAYSLLAGVKDLNQDVLVAFAKAISISEAAIDQLNSQINRAGDFIASLEKAYSQVKGRPLVGHQERCQKLEEDIEKWSLLLDCHIHRVRLLNNELIVVAKEFARYKQMFSKKE